MRMKFFAALALTVAMGSAMMVFATPPPAGSGSITGKVTYTGTPMKMKPIDMSKEPSCAKQHATPDYDGKRRDRAREHFAMGGGLYLGGR